VFNIPTFEIYIIVLLNVLMKSSLCLYYILQIFPLIFALLKHVYLFFITINSNAIYFAIRRIRHLSLFVFISSSFIILQVLLRNLRTDKCLVKWHHILSGYPSDGRSDEENEQEESDGERQNRRSDLERGQLGATEKGSRERAADKGSRERVRVKWVRRQRRSERARREQRRE
jgi:hypothetical protein